MKERQVDIVKDIFSKEVNNHFSVTIKDESSCMLVSVEGLLVKYCTFTNPSENISIDNLIGSGVLMGDFRDTEIIETLLSKIDKFSQIEVKTHNGKNGLLRAQKVNDLLGTSINNKERNYV
jgi:hypothetical protein